MILIVLEIINYNLTALKCQKIHCGPRPSVRSLLKIKFNMAANMETEEFATRCSFFLKRKNRHCKMIPGKGKRYCGEHSYLSDGNKV